jgi:hypothetical protein
VTFGVASHSAAWVVQVALSLRTELDSTTFTPSGYNTAALMKMLDQVVAWSNALAPLRAAASPVAA